MQHSHDSPLPLRIPPPPFLNIYATHPKSTPNSLNIPLPLNIYTRPSQNLPLPPRLDTPFLTTICDTPIIYPFLQEYTPFSTTICDTPIIYPFLPEYTPLFYNYMWRYQNLPHNPRIYPALPEFTPPSHNIPPLLRYATLPKSTPPSQNKLHPFFDNYIIDTLIIHPSLPEYTPFCIKGGSQNIPHLSRIYPPFLQLYAMLSESIPPSQNLPRPPRIYPPP